MLEAPYILLADDSDDDTYFAKRCFAAAGTQLLLKHCSNGLEIQRALESCGPHLPLAVILDLKMPFMDGFDTLKWIRNQAAFAHLPVVILSSSDMDEDRFRAQQLGCTEFLVKPMELCDLEKLVKELVERVLARTTGTVISAAAGVSAKTPHPSR
jgi:CheY-like chemotaxis protein